MSKLDNYVASSMNAEAAKEDMRISINLNGRDMLDKAYERYVTMLQDADDRIDASMLDYVAIVFTSGYKMACNDIASKMEVRGYDVTYNRES